MHLHPKFEPLRRQLLYRDPLPTLETILKKLMAEEACFCELGSLSAGHPTTFALATRGHYTTIPC